MYIWLASTRQVPFVLGAICITAGGDSACDSGNNRSRRNPECVYVIRIMRLYVGVHGSNIKCASYSYNIIQFWKYIIPNKRITIVRRVSPKEDRKVKNIYKNNSRGIRISPSRFLVLLIFRPTLRHIIIIYRYVY